MTKQELRRLQAIIEGIDKLREVLEALCIIQTAPSNQAEQKIQTAAINKINTLGQKAYNDIINKAGE